MFCEGFPECVTANYIIDHRFEHFDNILWPYISQSVSNLYSSVANLLAPSLLIHATMYYHSLNHPRFVLLVSFMLFTNKGPS